MPIYRDAAWQWHHLSIVMFSLREFVSPSFIIISAYLCKDALLLLICSAKLGAYLEKCYLIEGALIEAKELKLQENNPEKETVS